MYQNLSDEDSDCNSVSRYPYLYLDIDIEHCWGIQLQHFTFVIIILHTTTLLWNCDRQNVDINYKKISRQKIQTVDWMEVWIFNAYFAIREENKRFR